MTQFGYVPVGSAGYGLFFDPPFVKGMGSYQGHAELDTGRLAVELAIVTLLAGGLLLYFKDAKSE